MKKIINLIWFLGLIASGSLGASSESLSENRKDTDSFDIFTKYTESKDINGLCIEINITKDKENSEDWPEIYKSFLDCFQEYNSKDLLEKNTDFENFYSLLETLYSIKMRNEGCCHGGISMHMSADKWPNEKLKEELDKRGISQEESSGKNLVERFEGMLSCKSSSDKVEKFLKDNTKDNVDNFSLLLKFYRDDDSKDLADWKKLYDSFVDFKNQVVSNSEKDLSVFLKINELVKAFDDDIKDKNQIKADVAVVIDTKKG